MMQRKGTTMALDLRHVPEEKQTYAMCLASVKANWHQLEFVRTTHQTEELCLAAIKQSKGAAIKYVHKQTQKICLEAVRQNGLALRYVAKPNPEICLAAVREDGYAIAYITDRTPEICLAAVNRHGMALEYIPKKEQTLAMAIAALKKAPASRIFLADRFRTPEVYKAAGYDYKPDDLVPLQSHTERERTEPR